ncbi:Gfo/Idh/MocA family oxidoreductase [Fulvivirgaceae bacterium BMA12]|uniref:Gfo/Idh/MocA family oxidoreductase n=1 Tax=Agaribacillus aureus TaxID=3051825 RepID=A0ABT8LHU2_9BACT|nr:Gfo/Idh/MocA family oxidoreductase [Fulvivirgaceae bacterium BMA12]
MGKKKFAVIGCGRIASRHVQHISNVGILKAVCDVKTERATALAKTCQANVYQQVEDLLAAEKDVDVVSICTPNGLHASHSIMALQAGFHVLCEKPMAISVADCQSMIDAAEKANKMLVIVKQNRFNPPIVAIKKAIDENKLGKIYSVQLNCFWNRNFNYYQQSDWKGSKALDGGTLYTQFSHFIDLLYWMLGDIREVSALIGNFAHCETIDFEDNGVVTLKFENGIIGTIHYTVNSYQKNMEGSLTVFGEKGTVKVGGQYLNELEYQQIENYQIHNLPKGNPPNNYGEYKGSMSNHDKVYKNLIEALDGKAEIATSGFEGLKTVEIIEKIYQQASVVSR